MNTKHFHATVLTIFPEMFPGPLASSLAGAALKKDIWSLDIKNIRDYGITKHKKVDDEPCGGGNGLIMRPDVLGNALDSTLKEHPNTLIYYPSPRGKTFTQKMAKEISQEKNIIILCGRFEGIDERIIEEYNARLVSVGDFVLSGGEIAAFVMLDSVVRLLPGVLINQDTLLTESFENKLGDMELIEHPLYTKPAVWRGRSVPQVLLSGNHAEIEKWKNTESLRLTHEKNRDT